MSASQRSAKISAILKAHDYSDGARAPLVDLLGAKNLARINTMLLCAQAVRSGGKKGGVSTATEAHSEYGRAFNDLCGYPAEYKESMRAMLRSHRIEHVAATYGWSVGRIADFLNGNAAAFHAVGR